MIKSPKLYVCDTGLAAFLMGFEDWAALNKHPVIGALWETHVVMQVVKHFSALGRNIPLWFWRTAYGEEVDLLIEQAGRFTAFEIKFNEQPDKAGLKGFTALEKMYGKEALIKGLIACRTADHCPVTDRIEAIPGNAITGWLR